jgi:hypothetical protein
MSCPDVLLRKVGRCQHVWIALWQSEHRVIRLPSESSPDWLLLEALGSKQYVRWEGHLKPDAIGLVPQPGVTAKPATNLALSDGSSSGWLRSITPDFSSCPSDSISPGTPCPPQ